MTLQDFPSCLERHNRLARLRAAVVITFASSLLPVVPAVGEDGVYTQVPEVVASDARGAGDEDASSDHELLAEGPDAFWIWGPDDNTNYTLRKTFTGQFEVARLRAAADNVLALSINGREVAASSSWQDPVEVDISEHLRDGENVLEAKVANQGGPAGFIFKLALRNGDDKAEYIISDASWAVSNADAKVRQLHKAGGGPWGNAFTENASGGVTNGEFQILPGYQVERLFHVPKEELGSWVAIAFDDKGRLIASDQGDKGLCRITPPAIGSNEPTKVERLDVAMTSAQGLLYAFDSLYVSVNGGPGSGLYRLKDTDGDDQYDEVKKLKDFRGGGEHGPHALRLAPDGKSIYVVCGNHTAPPFAAGEEKESDLLSSRIPTNWGEDLLLPRQWDANGHARGVLAPGGWIARTDPEGQAWEIVSIGYRNPYDMDFNADGELFAYDADMEWDLGSPWYRPTRIVHATSGSEFGWRSGTGKWPTYYVDSLPPVVDIGPGSPVGVCFGYGAKFPAKYQRALFICDWTFGTMYAIHLTPQGASYIGEKEEFLSRSPLPLTDNAVAPDGAMYFTVGGRGTQSELYRVTYVGDEPVEPVEARNQEGAALRALRRANERFHDDPDSPLPGITGVGMLERMNGAADNPLKFLGHRDRFIRYAARVALEHLPVSQWQQPVLSMRDPQALITGAVALARQGEASVQPELLKALNAIDISGLSTMQQLELLRVYQLVFIRLGEPTGEQRQALIDRLNPLYPARLETGTSRRELGEFPTAAAATDALNRELSQLLVYLEAPDVIAKTIPLLEPREKSGMDDLPELLARNRGYGGTIAQMMQNPPDEQQIHYAFVLRNMKSGWTLDQRKAYFDWFTRARKWSGGASFQKFLVNIENEAYENASEMERLSIEALGARQPFQAPTLPEPKGPGRDWTVDEVIAAAEDGLKGRNFENGRRMYAATRCVICHRFAGEGGATGPDLTQLAGRFNVKDLTESIIEPSKVISDQYRASQVLTTAGKVYTGRIVSETDEQLVMITDPEDPTKIVEIPRDEIEDLQPSAVSLMPKDLLKPLNEEEVLDLLAYLLSRGDPNHPMFRK